jgi:hypothetical protein
MRSIASYAGAEFRAVSPQRSKSAGFGNGRLRIPQRSLSICRQERANTIEIEGEQGNIRVANDRVVLETKAGEQHWSCPPALSEGSHHQDWFVGVATDFRLAVTANDKGNLEEAMLCARLIDLAQRSSAAGGVRLSIGDQVPDLVSDP